MTSQNTAPAIIHKLVETFEQNLDSYRSSKNETELRREFLDKFFTALGWDVANEKGYDELGKEVIHEFSVDVAGQQKKADYAFRVGRGEKFDFLVEAKKPSVKVETSQEAAFQIRRYGWSAKLPINILSDFEHLAVYDCRVKPSYNDNASFGRIMLIHYKDYVSRWNEIVEIFSPEAVRKGSFAKYAESMKGKKGTEDVDDAFLQEIERWRELLAKNIALRNDDIDIAGLNYSVQMTIDRIVFLRICEERGIEPENQLLEITNTDKVYEELSELFKRADTKYNSGLFHFKNEKEVVSRPDDLTLSLEIDDKVLKDIISNLYYPKSPYAFLYIPSDILGQVYERFLGKVIRLTAGHNAKVEEKPEVRKAGGVYYTPTYIVEYIVKNTVGKLVENKSPKDVASLKIVDPACGSGTFLLGTYQFLLDWHLNWYSEHEPEKAEKSKAIVKVGDGYRLTTAKKKEILLNNIHGVDIDAQAVEVTKLSLLLKVLENASGQLGLGLERVLPDLGNNIKCGNSLIGFDYFEGSLFPDEQERTRINPFNWQNEFKDVFARGGFDAVIGNPPYVQIKGIPAQERRFYENRYKFATGRFNIFYLFIEKTKNLARENGLVSLIVPDRLLLNTQCNALRKWLLDENQILEIVSFDEQVFDTAVVDSIILSFENSQRRLDYISAKTKTSSLNLNQKQSINIPYAYINLSSSAQFDLNFNPNKYRMILKLISNSVPLESIAESKDGIIQGKVADKLFITNKIDEDSKPLLFGENVERYKISFGNYWVNYKPKELMALEIKRRGEGVRPGLWMRNPDIFERPKILTRQTADEIIAAFDKDNYYHANTLHGTAIFDDNYHPCYVLGILNSKVTTWFYRSNTDEEGKTFAQIKIELLRRLPVPKIDSLAQKPIIKLVEQMLATHKSLSAAKSPQDKERLERQIQETNSSIDSLVYDLYGLNDEEIKIVEGK